VQRLFGQTPFDRRFIKRLLLVFAIESVAFEAFLITNSNIQALKLRMDYSFFLKAKTVMIL